MAMKAPPHPGRIIHNTCLEPLGISVGEAAVALRVHESVLAGIVDGRMPLSADMAVRLEMAFGGTADGWMRLQSAHDLARARSRAASLRIRRYRG